MSPPQTLTADRRARLIPGETTRAGRSTRVITATHDIGQVRWLADHVVLFIHGEVKAHQNVAQLLDRSSVEEAGAFVRGEIVE